MKNLFWMMLAAAALTACAPKPEPGPKLPEVPSEPKYCVLITTKEEITASNPTCAASFIVQADTRAYRMAAYTVFAGEVWGGKVDRERRSIVLNVHGQENTRRLTRLLALVQGSLEGEKEPKAEDARAFRHALRQWYAARFEAKPLDKGAMLAAAKTFGDILKIPGASPEMSAYGRIWEAALIARHGAPEEARVKFEALTADGDPSTACLGWMGLAHLGRRTKDEALRKSAYGEIVRRFKGKPNLWRSVYEAEMALLPPELRPKPPIDMKGQEPGEESDS